MKNYAVIQEGKVTNVIVAESLKIAEEVSFFSCVEIDEFNLLKLNDEITPIQLKKIESNNARRAKELKAIEIKAEADRVAAIEAENERLRQVEADRLAVLEASKPKTVTGIFVKVEPN